MQTLRWTFDLPGVPKGVVTRLRRNKDGHDEPQTLILLSDGAFHPILGSNSRGGLGIGPQLPVNGGAGWGAQANWAGDPAWDPYSGSVLFCCDNAVYRLTSDDRVELVAGRPDEGREQDGLGWDARLDTPRCLSADGHGLMFCRSGEDSDRLTKLQLPASWRATPAGDSAVSSAAAAAAAGPTEGRVRVTTLPVEAPRGVWGLECASTGAGGAGSSLIMSTSTAVFRLSLNGGEPGALELLAGSELNDEAVIVDGRGPDVRFCDIFGLSTCADGTVVVADVKISTAVVRRLAPDGDGWAVSTLTPRLDEGWCSPAILPNGYLALCSVQEDRLLVLDLGLEAPPLALPAEDGSAATAGPPRRTLHADMGALLTAQPDGTADLILVVGDRRFHAHRAILSARSDYFKQRLAPERFADGAAAELSLPDADPAAFELLLRFLYTGSADISSSLAPSVAELSDRLLLPELCADAQAVVLSGVCAATVVGSLLWADRLGGTFSGLLSSLKAWYLEHHEEVHEAAPESVERLSGESPKLMAQLYMDITRSAKRRRTG
ncbi:hypothetical protein HYH03_007964 [Edaphochlamys debaryana]|uniref:BTB domain-containing protein n=1 Tax=Edaphochlamys debaryana TaxID=47281 RepID=A0A835Y0Q9_9CHLO|nr:hypothetical protein HYH03_007964 [Edaphochlamys debaryana]|eukprot:KAG2493741.1 hypothetical protein HYH03_007964 [Edaphochlamys debaryana]